MKIIIFMAVFLGCLVSILDCRTQLVKIITSLGAVSYSVEVVDGVLSRAIGLMYRRPLPANSGMLFLYKNEQNVVFWMKNVFFPLDIIFIDNSGRIIKICSNTTPNDPAFIHSNAPIIGVLELNGGSTKRAHIKVGDFVSLNDG